MHARSGRMRPPRPLAAATVAELLRCSRSAHRSADSLRRDQLVALNRTLESASDAPFWADHLGVARSLEDLDELRLLPTVDKQRLKGVAERERLTADPPTGTRTLRTSGTTGEPFQVQYSPGGAWWQGVLRVWVEHRWGLRPWHRRASISLFPHADRRGAGLLARARSSRQLTMPNDADIGDLARRVATGRPAAVSGYPHLLIELGEALEGRHQPRAVITHGETLAPESRASLGQIFGSDPFDQYGTAECGFVAWQCHERDLYHVHHDAVLVEIVGPGGEPRGANEPGELVLTQLWNPLTPFVRYRTGDSSAWSSRPCRCGSQLPALTHLHGRTYRWILDARHDRVAPQRLWMGVVADIEAFNSIRRYQVRQRRDRSITIEIVPTDRFTPALEAEVIRAYRRLLGALPIEVRRVDRLSSNPAAKFEVITSEAMLDHG